MLCVAVLTLCLCGAYADYNDIMLDTFDIAPANRAERCKTGYFQLATDPCCVYRQCEPDKTKAFRRKCMKGTYWNSELCACDWDWIPGSCNETLDAVCQQGGAGRGEACTANQGMGECCLTGRRFDDHRTGFGPKYVRDAMNTSKYTIPECNEEGTCPHGGVFSIKYCACEPKFGDDCACSHWDFKAPRPLDGDDTHMSPGNCRTMNVSNTGLLNCSNVANPRPATIPATQKFYLGKSGAMFGKVEDGFSDVFTSNSGPSTATIEIEFDVNGNNVKLLGEISGKEFEATVTSSPPGGETVEYQWFVITVHNGNMTVVVGVTYTDGSFDKTVEEMICPGSFQWKGNKCPLKLGQNPPVVYYDFGYCTFGDWSDEDYDNYGENCIVPDNPNPASGSSNVFRNWA